MFVGPANGADVRQPDGEHVKSMRVGEWLGSTPIDQQSAAGTKSLRRRLGWGPCYFSPEKLAYMRICYH